MIERPPPEVDWEQPFPTDEYDARRTKVAGMISARGWDAIYVTNPSDLCYLTGYDMIWFHLKSLTGCLLNAAGDLVFFDYLGHQTIVETTPEIRDVRWIDDDSPEDPFRVITQELAAQGLNGKTVAVQRWNYAPHADVMDALIDRIGEMGIETADGSYIVQRARLVKSEREVAVIRAAAGIADNAMAAARDVLAPGLMETEIEACIMHSMMTAGGGDPGIRCMIGSGPRAGTHHSPPQHRRIGSNELVFIDFCSSLHRYHVNLNRTFAMGEVDPRWHELMEKASTTIDHIVETVKPGDPWSAVQRAGDENTDAKGIRGNVWYVGGYAMGIAMPPDWCGDYWVKPKGGLEDPPLEPGMVFNFEGQFDDTDGWAGGSGAAYIDSLLMTDTGLEVLSRLPRTITTASA